ncbi:MAG: hypothetical protein OXS29_08845 [bacterium]|nr:hypothetical protein [bacterium]MDE0287596.1 hypothetical protein [bacterium]MDE0440230.1 hypothetical protein [bacterium]
MGTATERYTDAKADEAFARAHAVTQQEILKSTRWLIATALAGLGVIIAAFAIVVAIVTRN